MQQLIFLAIIAAAMALASHFCLIKKGPRSSGEPDVKPPPQQWPGDGSLVEELVAVIDILRDVMAHPQLGGPGFLTVQFLDDGPTVISQFPNIHETLYRQIACGKLAALSETGIPEALFGYEPTFETESGGMVLISAKIRRVLPLPEGRRERETALESLSAVLGRRYPAMTVNRLGSDILLTPSEGGNRF